MSEPHIVIVASYFDVLSSTVKRNLNKRGLAVLWYTPQELAGLPVNIREERFYIHSSEVNGILWRASPEMPLSADFSDAKTAATWLAALQLPSLAVSNRYDAQAWKSSLSWSYWHSRLRSAGVKASPCRASSQVSSTISAFGYVLGNDVPLAVSRAAKLLHQWGVTVASVSADAYGAVCEINVNPTFGGDFMALEIVADLLENNFYVHCAVQRPGGC